MPGGKAQKPGDIQTAMSGKTIEVLNTDAEGRLILADAIHYAKQLGVTHIVDAATLTGAIVVALANINVGVFGSDQAWTDRLLASAKATGEKMWQLPMDDEYREFIKGSFADIQNIGSGKGGGSITGAWSSSANSPAILRGFTQTSPAPPGTTTPKPWLSQRPHWRSPPHPGPPGPVVLTIPHSDSGVRCRRRLWERLSPRNRVRDELSSDHSMLRV